MLFCYRILNFPRTLKNTYDMLHWVSEKTEKLEITLGFGSDGDKC